MNVLIACEESQRVCEQFRLKGHNAFSCDILNCSGGHPEWHIKGDVLPFLDGHCEFITMDFKKHLIPSEWDLIIAFPPCTHLAVSGARHFEKKRKDGRQKEAINFFESILNAKCDKICVENPVNIIGGNYMKTWFPEYDLPGCTQYIQPYEFGDPVRKKTCLWLKGLTPLQSTNIVEPEIIKIKQLNKISSYSGSLWHATDENGKIIGWDDPRTAQIRSKTYPGIAQAMAEQWG